jgi:hypothetical protein
LSRESRNGSSIVFIDLAPAPTDPNFDRFGSLSLTHVIIEEVGEVVHRARSVITSRKNASSTISTTSPARRC